MWIEVVRIALLVFGGAVAVFLAAAPRLACRRYAEAVIEGHDRAAGFWAFLAVRGGTRPPST